MVAGQLGISVGAVYIAKSRVLSRLKERIQEADCNNGFLFDGFPRTLAQAEAMRDAKVAIDAVVEIEVPDEEIVRRLSGRRVHLASGRVYHVSFKPPKVAGKDDVTGEDLIQRDDDREETIRKRLGAYHEQTEVVCDFYRKLGQQGAADAPAFVTVNGAQPIDDVKQAISEGLSGI